MTIQVQPPNEKLIAQASANFESENEPIESALHKLFALYPKNSDLAEVLLKVVVLNRLYSTQIYAVLTVAEHIAKNAVFIDAGLALGNPDVVDTIAAVPIQGKVHNFFSFATKYCSWHNPDAYPIYDSRVDWYLWRLQRQEPFSELFKKNEYADYSQFRNIVSDLRKKYALENVSFKKLDEFIWLHGDRASLMADLQAQSTSAESAAQVSEP